MANGTGSRVLALATVAAVALVAAGCGSRGGISTTNAGVVDAVGAENQYADVIRQIGGRYVQVAAILDNPNTDPHTFESSPSVARQIGAATLIVQNGLGYDDFMTRIESATHRPGRQVINVQHLLGRPDSTANPHLWYDPETMPAVAAAIGRSLSGLQPAHAAYFQGNVEEFDHSLGPWLAAISAFRSKYRGTPVATTEPVADDLLEAMGVDILTPFRFQADLMNGTDPSPQDISLEKSLLTLHRVKVLCYNEQVVDSLARSIRQSAVSHRVPVVGVYETMPTPGYDYQSWMLAEVDAIERAVVDGVSTEHL